MDSLEDSIAARLQELKNRDAAELEARKASLELEFLRLAEIRSLLISAGVLEASITTNEGASSLRNWFRKVFFGVAGVPMTIESYCKQINLCSVGSILFKFTGDLPTPENLQSAISEAVARKLHEKNS